MMAERFLPYPCRPNDLLLPSSRFDFAGTPSVLVRIDIDTYSGLLLVSLNVDPLTAVCSDAVAMRRSVGQ